VKRAAGFSLIEVLAALTLLALVLLGVYSGIRTATQIVRSGDASIERMDEVRSAQQFLRRELAQTLTLAYAVDDNGDGIIFHGDEKEIRFVAPLPGYLGKLGPQMQTVRLVADGRNTLRLEVSFAMLPPDGTGPRALGEPEVLLTGIRKGSFAFRGLDEHRQPGPWGGQWADGRHTPSLVRISLDIAGGVPWPQLDAAVRVDPTATVGPVSLTRGLRSSGIVR
jgi:general secretion pathway protein J